MQQLQTQKRDTFGKDLEQLRSDGFVPAEIYGHGKENVHISFSQKDFLKILKESGEGSMIEVLVDGTVHPVLIHEVQKDPVGGQVIHTDFYEVRMDEKVRTEVPVEFVGEAPAVKTYGGILVKSLENIEVEALPAHLPSHIEVDLSSLVEMDQAIYVKDILVKGEYKIMEDPETAVASITEQQVEEETTAPSAAEIPTEAEEAAAKKATEAENEGK